MKTRDEYVADLHERLDEWNEDIDKLEQLLAAAADDAELTYAELVVRIREKRNAALAKLDELSRTSDDAWESLKDGAENVWDELKDAVEDVRGVLAKRGEKAG